MGKIRVHDLASRMGIANQDLVFKLRSIGVRVDDETSEIDTEILQAILEGKKLPQPREVILRDRAAAEKAGPARRIPPLRRPAVNPLRPARPRTIIHRVEPRIRTLPSTERPVPAAATSATAPHAPPSAAVQREEIPPPAESMPGPPSEREVATPVETTAAATAEVESPVSPAATGPPPVEVEEERRPDREEVDLGPAEVTAEEALEPARITAERTQEPQTTRRKRRRRKKEEQEEAGGEVVAFARPRREGPVTVVEGMTVRDFADKLGMLAKDLMRHLLKRGLLASINQVLEPELAKRLAEDLGFEAMVVTFEKEVQLRQEVEMRVPEAESQAPRAPVVTIMGHVDHGKTTLLDAIRSSKIVEEESGGITQHIGAYQVDVDGRKVVFVDTPGHEAFTRLRARGAQVTDIVVLVVAADDGVMPQTLEAIDHAKAAGVPIVVAVNKIDKSNASPDRVKHELGERGLVPEEWGGDTVMQPISALKKEGLGDLLEMILLTADLQELKAAPEIPAQGVILEARKEIGRGIVATVLVQDGTLRVSDAFVSGATWGRVRAMSDDLGQRIEEAGPATPVEVTGFSEIPEAGDPLQVVDDESKARSIADFRRQEQRQRELAPGQGRVSLMELFEQIERGEFKELSVVVKADVQGSVEVLRDTLEKLSTDRVKVRVIHAAIGAVSANDVLLASASGAIIVGFNVRPERMATELAEKEQVDIRLHTVIYELSDELRKAMVGLLDPTTKEVSKGRAEVRETFKIPKIGTVAGCHVVEGSIPRGALARLVRDNVVVYEGRLASLKRFKDDVSEVRTGFDCGIGLERFHDFKPGDSIEAYVREEVAPTL